MTRLSIPALALSLLSALSGAHLAEYHSTDATERPPTVTILVYNYARVRDKTLDRAQKKAARIIRRSGIETAWRKGPISQTEAKGNAAFSRGFRPAELILRVLPRSMSKQLAVPHTCFGFAQMSRPAKFPSVASVFFHRVKDLSSDRVLDLRVVLGHVMAHEIGHLLLGEKGHSRSGIMNASWKRAHLKLATLEHLLFTDEEAATMRANVRARVQPEGAP